MPIEFAKLVEATIQQSTIRDAIGSRVTAKMAGAELDRGPRIEALSGFIERELARLEAIPVSAQASESSIDVLNELFREVVNEVWAPAEPGD